MPTTATTDSGTPPAPVLGTDYVPKWSNQYISNILNGTPAWMPAGYNGSATPAIGGDPATAPTFDLGAALSGTAQPGWDDYINQATAPLAQYNQQLNTGVNGAEGWTPRDTSIQNYIDDLMRPQGADLGQGLLRFAGIVLPMLAGPLAPLLMGATGLGSTAAQALISAAGGGLGGAANGGLAGALEGALTGGLGSFAGSTLGHVLGGLGGAVGGDLGSEIDPVAAAASGSLSGTTLPGLTVVANTGSALGSVLGGLGGSASSFADEFNGTNTPGAGAGSSPNWIHALTDGSTTLDPLTVTPNNTPSPLSGVGGVVAGLGGSGGGTPTPDQGTGDNQNGNDNALVGAVGNVIGNAGTSLLSGVIGGGGGTGPGSVFPGSVATPSGGAGGGGGGGGTPPSSLTPTTAGPAPVVNDAGTPGGGGAGAAAGPAGGAGLSTGAAAAGGPAAAAPDIKIQGSMAPDIYPWRQLGAAA